jgi:DNA-directed RNA polymerase subunit RPC12/RpoP
LEERQYAVGDRVEKLCVPCGEERGHVVVSLNKRGQISRVNCPRCGVKTAFKKGKTPTGSRHSTKNSAPYDWTLTYRKGQTMTHPTFGFGEVTAVIEPQKIDVLFSDKVRRLIHARSRS